MKNEIMEIRISINFFSYLGPEYGQWSGSEYIIAGLEVRKYDQAGLRRGKR